MLLDLVRGADVNYNSFKSCVILKYCKLFLWCATKICWRLNIGFVSGDYKTMHTTLLIETHQRLLCRYEWQDCTVRDVCFDKHVAIWVTDKRSSLGLLLISLAVGTSFQVCFWFAVWVSWRTCIFWESESQRVVKYWNVVLFKCLRARPLSGQARNSFFCTAFAFFLILCLLSSQLLCFPTELEKVMWWSY